MREMERMSDSITEVLEADVQAFSSKYELAAQEVYTIPHIPTKLYTDMCVSCMIASRRLNISR